MFRSKVKCAPTTGRANPQYDQVLINRTAMALDALSEIDISYGPQNAIAGRIDILRQRCLGKRGVPLPGLRLSQVSQAGKTKTFQRYRERLLAQSAATNGTPNPWQVLYLGLEVRITVKMMCQQLLRLLGDPFADRGNTDEVKLRVQEFMAEKGVELLIIDEVQHLARDSQDKVDVTDELKRFLDMGIVPVVMAGNEDSKRFFERNPQLASRLGTPLELRAVDPSNKSELRAFAEFCHEMDNQLVAKGVFQRLSGLASEYAIDALIKASAGHVGRVSRLIEAALEHAVSREAEFIELFDLACAIENFAIPQGYIRSNPLS
jgi:hypothetical protein